LEQPSLCAPSTLSGQHRRAAARCANFRRLALLAFDAVAEPFDVDHADAGDCVVITAR
jgi:hypothetical protein